MSTVYAGEKEEEEDVTMWRSHQKVSKSTVSNKEKVERRQEEKGSSTNVG